MAVSWVYRLLWVTGIVFGIVPDTTLGLLSDYKICGDSECESLMSRVQATRDHHGKDCRFLSFRRGDTVFVYHKLTGKGEDLWAGTIDKQFGYFPKDAVEEEQIYATMEKVVETKRSDFFCMDKFGYPVDFSDLDSDDDNADHKIQIQEPESTETIPDTDYKNAEGPSMSADPTKEFPVSAQQAEGTTTEGDGNKNSDDAAVDDHVEERDNPAVLNEQGGSPSSWLGLSVTGWLGLEKEEQPVNLAQEEEEEERKHTKNEKFTSSVTGWLGFGREGKPDDAVESRADDKGAADSFTSMSQWLGFGGETKIGSSKTEEDDQIDIGEETEEVKFRGRRISLDLEGSQLDEEDEKEMRTLDWIGNALGFAMANQESDKETGVESEAVKTIGEEKEQSPSSSWLGIGNILGLSNGEREVDASTGSDFKDKLLEQGRRESEDKETAQTQREEEKIETDAQTVKKQLEVKTIAADYSVSSRSDEDKLNVEEPNQVPQSETGNAILLQTKDNTDNNRDADGSKNEFVFNVDQTDSSPQARLEGKTQAGAGMSSIIGEDRPEDTGGEDDQVLKSMDNNKNREPGKNSDTIVDFLTQPDINFGAKLGSVDLKSDTRGTSGDRVGEDKKYRTTFNAGEERADILPVEFGAHGDGHEGEGSAEEETDVLPSEMPMTQTDESAEQGQGSDNTRESSGNEPVQREEESLTAHSVETDADTTGRPAMIDNDTETEAHHGVLGEESGRTGQMGNDEDQESLSPQLVGGVTKVESEIGSVKEFMKNTEHQLQETDVFTASGFKTETGEPQTGEVEEAKEEEKQGKTEVRQKVTNDQLKRVETTWEVEKQQEIKEENLDVAEEDKVKKQGGKEMRKDEQQREMGQIKEDKQEKLKEGSKKGELGEIKVGEKQEDIEEWKEDEKRDNDNVQELKEGGKQKEMGKLKEEEKQGRVNEIKGNEQEGKEIQEEEKKEEVVGLKEEKKQGESEEVGEIKEERNQGKIKLIKEKEEHEDVEDLIGEEKQEKPEEVKGEMRQEEVKEAKEEKKQEEVEKEDNQKVVEEFKEEEKQVKVEETEQNEVEEEAREDEERREEVKQEVAEVLKGGTEQEEGQKLMKEQKREEEGEEEKEVKKQKGGDESVDQEVKEIKEEGAYDIAVEFNKMKIIKRLEKQGEMEEIKEKEKHEGVSVKEERKKETLEELRGGTRQEATKERMEGEEAEGSKEEEKQKEMEEFKLEEKKEEQEEAKDIKEVKGQQETGEIKEKDIEELQEKEERQENVEELMQEKREEEIKEEGKQEEGEGSKEEEKEEKQKEMRGLKEKWEVAEEKEKQQGVKETQEEVKQEEEESTQETSGKETEERQEELGEIEEKEKPTEFKGLKDGEQKESKEEVEESKRGGTQEDTEEVEEERRPLEQMQRLNDVQDDGRREEDRGLLPAAEAGSARDGDEAIDRLSSSGERNPHTGEIQTATGVGLVVDQTGGKRNARADLSDDKGFRQGGDPGPGQRHPAHGIDVDAVIHQQTAPHAPEGPSGSDDPNARMAETESGGAFGLFQNVLNFYTPTPVDGAKGSCPSLDTDEGEASQPRASRISKIEENQIERDSDWDQVDRRELHADSAADVSAEQPPGSLQTKSLPKYYKNLLAHTGLGELAILMELFGQHKLDFLEFMLGSTVSVAEERDNDESILSDIERLLHFHRESLAAPDIIHAPQEDKEKTRTLIALQKLEILITSVRETSDTGKSDTSGNGQAKASCVGTSCSTDSKYSKMTTDDNHSSKKESPSVALDDGVQRDEGMHMENHGQRPREDDRCVEDAVAPASRPHSQPGSPVEGMMKQMLDTVHRIAEESATGVHAMKELLVWTAQVVSALPDDIRPGPDLYGVPWEPVIISSLVGLATVLLFTCRCYRSVKSRMYRSKEHWMAAQVTQLLDEKCKVLETLSICQQEYEEIEDSLRDSGVLAQTQKSEHLEVKARNVEHAEKELERDLEQLKDQLDRQKEYKIEQQRRIAVLEEDMKTCEEETKDLQSQEEQAQTTLKVYSMNSDRLQNNLQTSGEGNKVLQESNTQLRQQAEGWAERVGELEAEMQRCEVTCSGMQQDVANKDERIMSLTDCLMRMKAWDSDLEEEGGEAAAGRETSNGAPGKEEENGRGDITHTQAHFQKVQKLIYAAKLNADLKSVDEDKDRVFAKLNDEVKAKEDLQGSIKDLENEKLSLQSDAGNYSDQVQRLQQKLQIMTEMYQENELKLHRLLTVEEKERLQKEEKLNKADKNIALAMEELTNYRQRGEEMEEELEKTKQSYQTQISAHEKKAHNNWLAARAADRELSDIRRENALLRQKLTDTQFKLDALDKDPYALDSLARPMPFRGERSPYGPSPLGRPASETRAFLSPPTLMDGPPARLSPRVSRGPMEPPGGQGEIERSGGPHSDSGSISPTWERDRAGPPPGPPVPLGPPGPFGHPGYMFQEPGGPMFRRPPPGALGPLPPPGSFPPGPPPPHLRGFPSAGPPGPHPADMPDGPYREKSLGPGEQEHRESGPGDRRTPPEADLRMGGPPPPGPPMGPMDGPFPRRAPYGPPPPDFYPPRGPGAPPMMQRWALPHPGMMFPPRFPPGGPPLPPGPHPHYAGPMRPFPPDSLPSPSMGPPPAQQPLPSPAHSQSPDEHRPSPEDAI